MQVIDALETGVRSVFPKDWVSAFDRTLQTQGSVHAKHFPLMNPFHVLLISVTYLVAIVVGKAIMKNRKRFELKHFSLVHNGFLILLSAYMCYESIYQAVTNNYSLWGNPVDPTEKGFGMARILWIFYASKPLEFIDTFIMILKKNDRQVSFLHVYHHVTIFIIWWIVVFFGPGGDGYFSAAQNSFVHVLMYSYYLLASLGFTVPWKNYITLGQMTQFGFNMLQALYDMFYPTAVYPKFLAQILFFYMITLLILFGNFYTKNKNRAREERGKEKKSE